MNGRQLWTAGAAVAALAFLIAMVVTGALPEQRQLVKFEARGVMKLEPDLVTRVEIHRGDHGAVLLRAPGGSWAVEGGGTLSAELAQKVSLAVQFMNTAGPIRTIDAADLQGANLRDFGLDPPALSVVLFQGARAVIGARFGTHNPEQTAQYMMVEAGRELILMSRFVGQEWESVAQALFSHRAPDDCAPARTESATSRRCPGSPRTRRRCPAGRTAGTR